MPTIEEIESPPPGHSQGSPALASPQKAELPKKELRLDVIDSSPVDTSQSRNADQAEKDERKQESTAMSFEGAKRGSGAPPGLRDYSEFARPSDELEKAQYFAKL